jgi:hypothetical protein
VILHRGSSPRNRDRRRTCKETREPGALRWARLPNHAIEQIDLVLLERSGLSSSDRQPGACRAGPMIGHGLPPAE